jgi:hypothetical protein
MEMFGSATVGLSECLLLKEISGSVSTTYTNIQGDY